MFCKRSAYDLGLLLATCRKSHTVFDCTNFDDLMTLNDCNVPLCCNSLFPEFAV